MQRYRYNHFFVSLAMTDEMTSRYEQIAKRVHGPRHAHAEQTISKLEHDVGILHVDVIPIPDTGRPATMP